MTNNLNYSLLRSSLVEQGCEREFMDIFYSQNRCTCFCAGVRDIMGGDEYFLNRAFRWEKTYMGVPPTFAPKVTIRNKIR